MRALGLGDNVFDVYENMGVAYPGGNAVNVAVNAARLGCDAGYLGAIATDASGDLMVRILEAEGVDMTLCSRPAGTTTKYCIEDVLDGERSFKRNELGENWVGPLNLLPEHIEIASSYDVVFSSCYAKMADQMDKLRGVGGVMVFDFGEKEKYRTADYLARVLPAIDLAQFSMSGMSVREVLDELERMGIACPVLVTRGSQPPLVAIEGEVIEGEASMGSARDTMGAGDAFATAFATSLVADGWHKGAVPCVDAIEIALQRASDHACRMCQVDGGFGHACDLAGEELVEREE